MNITTKAVSGTLESSDVMIEISPGGGELQIEVESIVKQQFGDTIERVVREILDKFHVTDADVYVNDRGALDCTIRARVETAVKRAGKEETK